MQDDGGEVGKLEAFMNFCEDTIFEMQHAASMNTEDDVDTKKKDLSSAGFVAGFVQ
jgi:ryanodine receptor 2